VRSVRTPAELTTAFRTAGLKVTPQRQLLFRLLHDNRAHPTADALFATASVDMPGISLRTVYQTLNDLVAMGELQALSVGGGSTRFDPNTDDHHHLVCSSCGVVRDVYLDGVGGLRPQGIDGFDVTATSVVFHGRCTSCHPSSSNPTK